MPHFKFTINLSELKPLCDSPEKPIHALLKFIHGKKASSALSSLEQAQTQGYRPFSSWFLLLILPFLDQANLHSFFHSTFCSLSLARKDVFYRLKNNPLVNWRKILLGMAKEFQHRLEHEETHSNGSKSVSAFIVDDSPLLKSGNKIEGSSRMWDHAKKAYVLGFKCLVLGFWDGKSMIPIDFSLHREKGRNKNRPFGFPRKKLRMQYSKKRPPGSCGSARKKELDSNKIDNTIKMVKRGVKNGFKVDYMLTDSWFACEKLLLFVVSCIGVGNLIAQCKLDKRNYTYKGKQYTAKELKHLLRKNWKRARSLKMRYIKVKVEYKGVDLNLFFTRNHGNNKVRLLCSTDLKLSFTETYRIYAIRWIIEVFFKEAKQLLGLGKCQSNDFDAQIADTTLTMVRYTILNFEKRIRSYQTLGGLFKESKEQSRELLLSERIWGQVVQILRELTDLFPIDLEELLSKIMSSTEQNQRLARIIEILSAPPKDANEESFLKSA